MITNYQIQMDTYSFNMDTKDYEQIQETILVDTFKKLETVQWCFDAIPIPKGFKRANTPLPKEYSHILIVYSLLEYSGTVKELRHVYFVMMKE